MPSQVAPFSGNFVLKYLLRPIPPEFTLDEALIEAD